MSKSTAVKPVTAREVRVFLSADPKRLAALSPEARATVEPDAEGRFPKGRLHREAVKVHNQRRRTAQYVSGATKAANTAAKEQAVALRAQAVKAGYTVGARGPLPKEFLASLKG